MKYLLIIWFITRADGNLAEPLGDIHSAEFSTKETCEVALAEIKKEAGHINGRCVAK